MVAEAGPSARERIDAIERGYEFFLAYAAQGLKGDAETKSGGEMRAHLAALIAAVDGLTGAIRVAVADKFAGGGAVGDEWDGLLEVIERDASATSAALGVVSAQPSVSSQLIDNLNANVHFRALLTGLFLVDEALEPMESA